MLKNGLEAKSQNVNDLGKEEFAKYKEEMVFFIDRLEAHPTMTEIRASQPKAQ